MNLCKALDKLSDDQFLILIGAKLALASEGNKVMWSKVYYIANIDDIFEA